MSIRTLIRIMRASAIVAMALLLLAAFGPATTSPAFAQERVTKPWSLRDMLFFSRKSSRVEPRAKEPQAKARKKSTKPRSSVARAPAEPRVPIVEKLPDAKVVLVVGDFVGAGIAEGLEVVFAPNPRVRIVNRSNGSSGFARPDYYDWTGNITGIIESEKPAAVIFVVGANDRQQIKVGATREPVRSEGWTAEYTLRATNFAKTVAQTRVPLIWVGASAFKPAKMNSDMLAMNEIYRAVTSEARGEFVDVWDGFVDENGGFVTTGPDINGQPVRLRASDGINFTAAGKRKLAFYTEKPLKKLIGEAGAADVAALPEAALPGAPQANIDVGKIDRTVPVSLSDPSLDGGNELMGLKVVPKSALRLPGERLSVEGIAPEAAPGRADDFSWPPRVDQATAAITPSPTEAAAAIPK